MICKIITSVWTSADIIKNLLTFIDIVRVYNLKIEKLPGGREFFLLIGENKLWVKSFKTPRVVCPGYRVLFISYFVS